ncbi:MAG: Fpg/Nei family DNA glycosylase, partial [Acidimicrobiales bacterium]
MPELPEVEALARSLSSTLAGEEVTRIELGALSALKTFDPPLEALVGRLLGGVGRKGKFLLLQAGAGAPADPAGGLWLVVHLALGGWIRWRPQLPPARARPGRGPLALRLGLSGGGGLEVTEAGTEKRLALWVVRRPEDVGPLAALGPDPLAPGFTGADLGAALQGRTGHIKGVLTDQRVVAGVGNAYSDEVLHAARLSPFKPAAKLTGEELGRLHVALVEVLGAALARSDGLAPSALKAEKRTGMAVHGRAGLPCPVCGDTVREVSFASKAFQYCPTCQTGGK